MPVGLKPDVSALSLCERIRGLCYTTTDRTALETPKSPNVVLRTEGLELHVECPEPMNHQP